MRRGVNAYALGGILMGAALLVGVVYKLGQGLFG